MYLLTSPVRFPFGKLPDAQGAVRLAAPHLPSPQPSEAAATPQAPLAEAPLQPVSKAFIKHRLGLCSLSRWQPRLAFAHSVPVARARHGRVLLGSVLRGAVRLPSCLIDSSYLPSPPRPWVGLPQAPSLSVEGSQTFLSYAGRETDAGVSSGRREAPREPLSQSAGIPQGER